MSLSSPTEKTKTLASHIIYLWVLMEIGMCGLIAATGHNEFNNVDVNLISEWLSLMRNSTY